MQPEARLVKNIQAYISKKGGFIVKIHGGSNPFQQPGISDLIGVYEGRGLALEVKLPGGKVSKIQAAFLRRWHDAGGVAAVVRSVEDVEELLGGIDEGRL
jgi:hypothetical protein